MIFRSKTPNTLKMKLLRYSFVSLILLVVSVFSQAAIPPKPVPPRLVNDMAGILNAEEVARLEQKLVAFNDSTSTQIAVVTLKSLYGYDIDDLAQRIGQEWKVGQKEYDNGVVVLIKPKIGNERGQAAISTGYGIEALIPDAVARRIVDNEMIPYFRQNDYSGGINIGTDMIMDLVTGRFKAADYKEKDGGLANFLIPFVIIVLILMFIFRNNSGSNRRNFGSSNLPFWLLLSMMNSGGRNSGGDWGGFSGGGGGGGGGFGGFGGGGFGGGGASGSW